jgi:4-hydroxybenzoate polyprenyltransferase
MNFENAEKSGKFFSKLSRPQNVIYPGLLSSFTAYYLRISIVHVVYCYLIILFLYAIAASFNNITDVKTDKLNSRKDNPLTSQKISKRALQAFILACALVLLVLQMTSKQPLTIYICAIYLLLIFCYSDPFIKLKSRGFLSIICLSICYGSLPFLLGVAQARHQDFAKIADFTILQLLLLFPVLLAKDYKDLIGDKLTYRRTPLVIYGPKIILWIATASLVVAGTFYILLARHYGLNLLLSIVFICVYFIIIFQLHRKLGIINQLLRDTLTVIMLIMSVALIRSIF